MTGKTTWARAKLDLSIKLAREASRDSWQNSPSPRERRIFKSLSLEALSDARYWLGVWRAAQ